MSGGVPLDPDRHIERRSWPDPNRTHGPYKILPRTCGDFIVYDERLPPGKVAGGGATVAEAEEVARALVAAGSPVRAVERPIPRAAPPRARPTGPKKSARKGT